MSTKGLREAVDDRASHGAQQRVWRALGRGVPREQPAATSRPAAHELGAVLFPGHLEFFSIPAPIVTHFGGRQTFLLLEHAVVVFQ